MTTEENLIHKLLFVSDRPTKSKINTRTAVFKLFTPMFSARPQISTVSRTDPDFSVILIRATLKGYKIIALGDLAAKALINAGVYNFFKLPVAKKTKALPRESDDVLLKCKLWIQG